MRRANFVGTKFGGGGKRGRAKIPSPQPSMREISTGVFVSPVECREAARHYLP
jgi:hypothetical protein